MLARAICPLTLVSDLLCDCRTEDSTAAGESAQSPDPDDEEETPPQVPNRKASLQLPLPQHVRELLTTEDGASASSSPRAEGLSAISTERASAGSSTASPARRVAESASTPIASPTTQAAAARSAARKVGNLCWKVVAVLCHQKRWRF